MSRFSPIGETSSAGPHEPAQIQRIELAHALRSGAQWPVLKIQYTGNGEVVLTVSGRLQADHVGELTALIDADRSGRTLVLDLKDLVRVDEKNVRLLCACERDGGRAAQLPAVHPHLDGARTRHTVNEPTP